MPTDRYTKLVLTIAAVALCVIALPKLREPQAMAASGHPLETIVGIDSGSTGPGRAESAEMRGAATSAKPLRWRALNAYHDSDSDHSVCGTVVTVRNVAPSSVDVDVQWFHFTGVSQGLSTRSVSSEESQVFWTNANVELHPIFANGASTNTADFAGWAERCGRCSV